MCHNVSKQIRFTSFVNKLQQYCIYKWNVTFYKIVFSIYLTLHHLTLNIFPIQRYIFSGIRCKIKQKCNTKQIFSFLSLFLCKGHCQKADNHECCTLLRDKQNLWCNNTFSVLIYTIFAISVCYLILNDQINISRILCVRYITQLLIF